MTWRFCRCSLASNQRNYLQLFGSPNNSSTGVVYSLSYIITAVETWINRPTHFLLAAAVAADKIYYFTHHVLPLIGST